MFPTPVMQEHAPLQDLLKDPPANTLSNVPKVQDGVSCVRVQGSLLKVLRRQPVQELLFALEELQEMKVCLRPGVDNGLGTLTKNILAGL